MSLTIAQLEEQVRQNPLDAKAWVDLGLQIAEEEQNMEKSLSTLTKGLCYQPFDPELRLQRGRKFNSINRFARAVSDLTLACRLKPEEWQNWYYLSVSYNLWGKYEESAAGFEECAKYIKEKQGLYPIVDWLFNTYTTLGWKEKAQKALDLIDTSIPCVPLDYSYRKRVMLSKGEIDPEKFIDLDEIERTCIKAKDRPKLELVSQLYGLANYYHYIGNMEKYDETLLKLLEQPLFHNAFGYIKGVQEAKARGLIH